MPCCQRRKQRLEEGKRLAWQHQELGVAGGGRTRGLTVGKKQVYRLRSESARAS